MPRCAAGSGAQNCVNLGETRHKIYQTRHYIDPSSAAVKESM